MLRRASSERPDPARVGMIIVNWNSGGLLADCLASIAAQTVAPTRVIVVDNASQDNSATSARRHFPAAQWVICAENHGFAKANNLGVAQLNDCQWLCLINPDAVLAADFIETMLAAAADAPDYAAFAPLILQQARPDIIDSAGDEYNRSGVACHRLHDTPMNKTELKRGEVFAPTAAVALYRRENFLAMGGFDESFFCYYEDVDLGARLQLAGCRCLLVPEAVAWHVGGGTTGGAGNPTSVYYCQRNFILTYFKNMPMPRLLIYMPLHVWAVAKGVLKSLVTGGSLVALRATFAALPMLPGIILRRVRSPAVSPIQARSFLRSFRQ